MPSVLSEIVQRLTQVQKELVPTSEAYPVAFVQTGNAVYWTNRLTIAPAALTTERARIVVTVEMRLHRGKFTELQTNPTLQDQCVDDLGTLTDAFMRNRDLTSVLYPTRHPNLVPTSAMVTGAQLAVIPAPDGTDHFGAVITLSFAYLVAGAT
jgi:hypothetical protein